MIRFVHDWPLREGPFVIVFLSTYERKRDQRGATDFAIDGRRLAVLMDDCCDDNKNNWNLFDWLMKQKVLCNDSTFLNLQNALSIDSTSIRYFYRYILGRKRKRRYEKRADDDRYDKLHIDNDASSCSSSCCNYIYDKMRCCHRVYSPNE